MNRGVLKCLLAALLLCLAAAPAQAGISPYPKASEFHRMLPSSSVQVPPLLSGEDRRATRRLEREIGVPSLLMLATSLNTPPFRFLTYAWQTPKSHLSAQRLTFLKGSVRRYIRGFLRNPHADIRSVGASTVLTRPNDTIAVRPINARELVLVTLPAKRPLRAAQIAEIVLRNSAGMERAQPRFVSKYGTTMTAWQTVMMLNDPAGSSLGDFGPTVTRSLLKVIRSDGDLAQSQAHYVRARFAGNCLVLTPRNGSRSPQVHLVLDPAAGAASRVTDLAYGGCP